MGSDHEVYQDSAFAIPAIYFNDWPDRYIHTNLDTRREHRPDQAAVASPSSARRAATCWRTIRASARRRHAAPTRAPGPAAKATASWCSAATRNCADRCRVFGYDYFDDHAKTAGVPRPKLLDFEGRASAAATTPTRRCNFADGQRNAQQITNEVSAEFGPVPLELVLEYLQALERIGVVEQTR